MKLSLSTGLAAGVLALTAAPALAAPANVTVRVEGANVTRVESVHVTTTAAPVSRAGHDCSGTSAGGALDRATGGDWDATYFDGLGHFITTIKGEAPGGQESWTVWVNHGAASEGACKTELQEGDEVLFFVDRCTFDGLKCSNDPVQPLALTAPSTATVGVPGEVSVVRYDAAKKSYPVAGAKVTGPGIDATTDAAGKATVTFPAAGTVRLQATKPGLVRSETHDVPVSPVGAAQRSPDAPLTTAAPDKTAPRGKLTGFKDHQVFTSGPRDLRGSFSDSSGLKVVKLRLTKRVGKKCWYFSGKQERFRGTRCGRGAYFAIGDKADWSYLLPAQLAPGRYVLDAVAIDGAGNRTPLQRGSTRVVFSVR